MATLLLGKASAPCPQAGLWAATRLGSSAPAPGAAASGTHIYPINSQVEYLSGTLNQWISARVLSHNNDSTYNLDCKPLVPANRIRWPGGAASGGT